MTYGGRSRTFTLIALLSLAALAAVVIVLVAGNDDSPRAGDDPSGAVQKFLAAAGSGDGDTACGYLSIEEQRRVEQAAGPHVPCSQAFLSADLELAGKNYLTDLSGVDFSQSEQGRHATVNATSGGATAHFALVPVTMLGIEQQRYQPPSTNWRIDQGATELVRPVP